MKKMLALPSEVWKDIEGYEGLYQVSSLGRIVNVKKNRILIPHLGKIGYYTIILTKRGKHKTFTIHRLVAKAFIPNSHNYPTVDHINRIRTDNRIENLRWATYKLQYINSSSKDSVKKATSKPVLQYTLDGQLLCIYSSASEASVKLDINKSHICSCCKNRYGFKTAGGFNWKYLEN